MINQNERTLIIAVALLTAEINIFITEETASTTTYPMVGVEGDWERTFGYTGVLCMLYEVCVRILTRMFVCV